MGGRPTDPGYWRRWRAAHPTYRSREVERKHQRRLRVGREDRSVEYARRNAGRVTVVPEPLGELFPDLVRGARLMFREEDLARDLRQERELAVLEGRDPEEAATAFAERTYGRWAIEGPLLEFA